MSEYIRSNITGGTFFFTVTLANRQSSLLIERIEQLRSAYRRVQYLYPFKTIAICILPDHIHAIWQLPDGDNNFSVRWQHIKGQFSRHVNENVERSISKFNKREKGIWQRRYWEHQIRDDFDLQAHIDYLHINPVKHRYVTQAKDWQYSSFHRYVKAGVLPIDWGGKNIDNVEQFGE
jgi:putative transposase